MLVHLICLGMWCTFTFGFLHPSARLGATTYVQGVGTYALHYVHAHQTQINGWYPDVSKSKLCFLPAYPSFSLIEPAYRITNGSPRSEGVHLALCANEAVLDWHGIVLLKVRFGTSLTPFFLAESV
jgi:hypothetical protein